MARARKKNYDSNVHSYPLDPPEEPGRVAAEGETLTPGAAQALATGPKTGALASWKDRHKLRGIRAPDQEFRSPEETLNPEEFGPGVLPSGRAALLADELPERLLHVVVGSRQRGVVVAGEDPLPPRVDGPSEVIAPGPFAGLGSQNGIQLSGPLLHSRLDLSTCASVGLEEPGEAVDRLIGPADRVHLTPGGEGVAHHAPETPQFRQPLFSAPRSCGASGRAGKAGPPS